MSMLDYQCTWYWSMLMTSKKLIEKLPNTEIYV